MIPIADKIISIGTTNQEISNKLNINPSTLSRFLSGKSEMKFESLFQLIQTIYTQEEQLSVCSFYFKRLQNKRNIKCALEYFLSNKQWEDLMYVINREQGNCSNDIQELLPMYEVIYRMFHLKETINDAESKTGAEVDVFTKEGIALKKLTRLYSGKALKEYNFIYQGKDDVLEAIENLDDSYFKQSLENRLYDLIIIASSHTNDFDETKRTVEKVLSSFTSYYLKANAYYYLAKIESLSSFDNALKYINISINLFKILKLDEHIENAEERLLPFVFMYNNVSGGPVLPNLNTADSLSAYFRYKQGDVDGANEFLNKAVINYEFFCCYAKGIIYDDISYIWMSLIRLVSEKDTFFVKLPIKRLLDTGVDTESLARVLNINGLKLV